MGEKDITEKNFGGLRGRFADVVNVLLFNGEQRVMPEDLVDTTARSQFKADDGVLHEQERDVVKRWKHGKIVIALLGLENQTKPDANMPLRVFSYEGANYKSQLLDGEENSFYPVITLVYTSESSAGRKPEASTKSCGCRRSSALTSMISVSTCLRSAICRRSSWRCSGVISGLWRNIL